MKIEGQIVIWGLPVLTTIEVQSFFESLFNVDDNATNFLHSD